MKQLIEIKKKLTSDWFKFLQGKIIDEFQLLENEINKKNRTKIKYFVFALFFLLISSSSN